MSLTPMVDILLVEDNPGDVRLAQETLKDYKMQNSLNAVCDGEEAIKYLRREHPYTAAKTPDIIQWTAWKSSRSFRPTIA